LPYKILGVLLQDAVDFVEDVVDVLAHFLVAFLHVGGVEILDLLDVLGLPVGPGLTAVIARHVPYLQVGVVSAQYLSAPSIPLLRNAVVGNDVPVSIDDVADRLYGMEPEEFTAARDRAAKEADADARQAIKALRKPTVAAYVVNMLAKHYRDDVEALVELGDELRTAMAGKGDIRALSEERRELVRSLVQGAADAADRELTAAVEEEVAATLEAATADPELGQAVLSGRLVKPLRYAGFGSLPDLGDAVATPLPTRGTPKRSTTPKAAAKKSAPSKTPPKTASKTAGKEAAEQKKQPEGPSAAELTRLRSKVLDLAGTADDAQRRYDQASRAVVEARQLLDQAEKERTAAHKAASAAHKEAEKARRDLGKLERR
jgi:hypothetical protein